MIFHKNYSSRKTIFRWVVVLTYKREQHNNCERGSQTNVSFKSEVIKYISSRLTMFFLQVNNICLKTDKVLLQYTFYPFQYFITTHLHGPNLSTKVSVKKIKRKWLDGFVQLGWSRLINKLSLKRSLNLFLPEARISKWSKSIEQLHSSRW